MSSPPPGAGIPVTQMPASTTRDRTSDGPIAAVRQPKLEQAIHQAASTRNRGTATEIDQARASAPIRRHAGRTVRPPPFPRAACPRVEQQARRRDSWPRFDKATPQRRPGCQFYHSGSRDRCPLSARWPSPSYSSLAPCILLCFLGIHRTASNCPLSRAEIGGKSCPIVTFGCDPSPPRIATGHGKLGVKVWQVG